MMKNILPKNLNPNTYNNLIAAYDMADPRCYPGSGSTLFDLSGNRTDLLNPGGGASFPTYSNSKNCAGPILVCDATHYLDNPGVSKVLNKGTFMGDGANAEFRDTDADLSEWETLSGNAVFCVVIASSTVPGSALSCSWGFIGASNNAGKDLDIYTDIGLTNRGWNGFNTTPFGDGDSVDWYEVRPVNFFPVDTVSMIVIARLADGDAMGGLICLIDASLITATHTAPAKAEMVNLSGDIYGVQYPTGVAGAAYLTMPMGATFGDGEQNIFYMHTHTMDAGGNGGKLYINESEVVSMDLMGVPPNLFPNYTHMAPGCIMLPMSISVGIPAGLSLANALIFSSELTKAEIQNIFNFYRKKFGL